MNAVLLPLGLRLHNPGNLRYFGVRWVGMVGSPAYGDFLEFESDEYGIRAIAEVLHSYEKRGINWLGYKTLADGTLVPGAIPTWSPPTDKNPTAEYIANVCKWTGIDQDVPTNLCTMPIIKGIIRQENGQQPFSDATIMLGMTLANPQPEM